MPKKRVFGSHFPSLSFVFWPFVCILQSSSPDAMTVVSLYLGVSLLAVASRIEHQVGARMRGRQRCLEQSSASAPITAFFDVAETLSECRRIALIVLNSI